MSRTAGTVAASSDAGHARHGHELPCGTLDPNLWYAVAPAEVELAKLLCRSCPIRRACLEGALRRREPWGVWGGEIVEDGRVIPRKRRPGRPSNADRERDRTSARRALVLSRQVFEGSRQAGQPPAARSTPIDPPHTGITT